MKKIAIFLVLAAAILGFNGCGAIGDSALDSAMQRYINYLGAGDIEGFLSLVSTNEKFRFSSYDGTSGHLMGTSNFTKTELRQELTRSGGLFFAMFGGDSHYRYRDRIASTTLASWRRILDGYRWQSGALSSYVKWIKEDGEWRVLEVSDSVP